MVATLSMGHVLEMYWRSGVPLRRRRRRRGGSGEDDDDAPSAASTASDLPPGDLVGVLVGEGEGERGLPGVLMPTVTVRSQGDLALVGVPCHPCMPARHGNVPPHLARRT